MTDQGNERKETASALDLVALNLRHGRKITSTVLMLRLVQRAALDPSKAERRKAKAELLRALQMSDHFGRSSARIFADRLISERRRQFNDDPETSNP